MKLIKLGIGALLIAGIVFSCNDDENPDPVGLVDMTFSSFSAQASGDGTIVTVTPVSIGASSFTVDFGDPTSSDDVLTIDEQGGSVSYDYPNTEEEATYTIDVTANSAVGSSPITKTLDVTVVHVPDATISSVADAPTGSISNVFAIYTDGMELDGGLLEYRWGEVGTGGTALTVGDENLLRFSRLGSDAGVIEVGSIETSNAFGDGIEATHIHLDVNSDFSAGIDLLKVTLINSVASESYTVDGLALTDGEWTSFDLSLSTGFSSAVNAIDEIHFELGTGGSAKDHASIYVDNVYLYKQTGSTILNGDFEITGTYATSQWRFTTFTDGETNPFGSSSDGSDFDYNGNDTGDKTRGAKWSSSQAAGQYVSASSRYAYQALNLTPNTDYVLEYQYAIDDDNAEPIGGRHLVGLILNGQYLDGVDAVADVEDNLGSHQGFYAEGKFNTTPNDYGTYVQIPFTSNESGEVAVMFYSVAPDDAWIDNVKVISPGDASMPSADFDAEESSSNYLEFTFTNTSFSGASFVWDFGDGNSSTEKSPTHTYAADGNYEVVLTATNSAGSSMASEDLVVGAPAVEATFAAVVLNGTGDDLTIKTSDNADAFDMTPPSTIYDDPDTEPSPYTWSNSALDAWLGDVNNCPDDSEQPGSTSDGNKFKDLGDRGYKINEECRRLYQPVTVEVGVEYTFTIDSRSEAEGVPSEVFILNTAIADETGLNANGADDPSVDAYYLISNDFNSSKASTTEDTFTTSTFTFVPSTTEIIIYVRAPLAKDSSTEVFYDNIDIITPGF